ncbi:MAG: hypothetical protein EXQ66_06990 [Ilumatobacteraceae bacterium]|nr:hypothetical protein [Ilumatobacteraceae bacterium]
MRVTFPRLLVATLALSIVAISCGGSGDAMGGNSSTRLSDEAFCAKLTALQIQSPNDTPGPEAMLEMLTILRDLAKVAPTAELQGAFGTYIPFLEEMSKLDQNDPEAFSTVASKLFDPELAKAAEVLKTYSADVCGIVEP